MSVKIRAIVLILSLSIMNVSCDAGSKLPVMKIELSVIEEDGIPIAGAFVEMGFDQSGVVGGKSKVIRGQTDVNGSIKKESSTLFGALIEVEKQGYYPSKIDLEPRSSADPIKLRIKLRRILNPLPLYANHYFGTFPSKKGNFGFDLSKGDWTVPYGKGESPHIIFEVDYVSESIFQYDGRMVMRFPNERDGYIEIVEFMSPESRLKVPHNAPLNGYSSELIWIKKREGSKDLGFDSSSTNNTSPRGYFLRLNSEVNQEGDIVSANYAKFYGKIAFNPNVNEL